MRNRLPDVGAPLDLGSRELKFNNSTVRTSVRSTVPQVYTKAIFRDLLKAINDLPAAGRVTGGITKTTAPLNLTKAYLTYGWWLQNPNNIPTCPTTARTDPDGRRRPYGNERGREKDIKTLYSNKTDKKTHETTNGCLFKQPFFFLTVITIETSKKNYGIDCGIRKSYYIRFGNEC